MIGLVVSAVFLQLLVLDVLREEFVLLLMFKHYVLFCISFIIRIFLGILVSTWFTVMLFISSCDFDVLREELQRRPERGHDVLR